MSLCVSGLCLLWLLCSVASGLYVSSVSAPALYCRDLNHNLRLFGLEWRPAGSGSGGELRCLSGAALQRRAQRMKERSAAVEAERERAALQASVEAVHFLELLEREDDCDGDSNSSGGSEQAAGGAAVRSRSATLSLLPKEVISATSRLSDVSSRQHRRVS